MNDLEDAQICCLFPLGSASPLRTHAQQCLEPEECWPFSIVPMLNKIRPGVATPAFGLTPPLTSHSTYMSRLSPPVFRTLFSEQPRSSLLPKTHGFPGTWLSLLASKALQAGEHHRA